MIERHDDDQKPVILDGVDNPVVTDSDPQGIATPQRPCPWRAGVGSQQRDRTLDAGLVLPVDLLQCPEGSRTHLDLIAHAMSSPAQISLDLLPGDARPLFGHRGVESRDIIDLLCGT